MQDAGGRVREVGNRDARKLASLREKVRGNVNDFTQGRPSGNRANPGLNDETPLGFSEGQSRNNEAGSRAVSCFFWTCSRALNTKCVTYCKSPIAYLCSWKGRRTEGATVHEQG